MTMSKLRPGEEWRLERLKDSFVIYDENGTRIATVRITNTINNDRAYFYATLIASIPMMMVDSVAKEQPGDEA